MAAITPDRRVLAEASSYAELVGAFKQRIIELDTSYETIEEAAGLTARHLSKLLAPRAPRHVGPLTLTLVLAAIGCRLQLVEDPAALDRVAGRLTKRKPNAPGSRARRGLRSYKELPAITQR